MTGKRKRYSADFKAKVALEAIRGEQTVAQLAAKHGVHQTLINVWKKQAIEGRAGVFSGKAEAAEAAREGEIDQLHAKIGQLVLNGIFWREPPVD
jgi:transposase